MTRTLVFDTETTGKADFKSSYASAHQPQVVQLAALAYEDRRLVGSLNVIVKATCEIPQEAIDVHGITKQLNDEMGMSPRVVLPFFNNWVKWADRIVAHNLKFDMLIMLAAYAREGFPVESLSKPARVCTVLSTMDVLKLPGKYGSHKWPTLDEAYRFLVDKNGFDGAHDALVDAKACAEVLWKAEDAGAILKG